MSQGAGDNQIDILLMNDYGSYLALWPDDLEIDAEDLGSSQALIADLKAFAAR